MVSWVGCPDLAVSCPVQIFELKRLAVIVILAIIKAVIFGQSERIVISSAPRSARPQCAVSAIRGLAFVVIVINIGGRGGGSRGGGPSLSGSRGGGNPGIAEFIALVLIPLQLREGVGGPDLTVHADVVIFNGHAGRVTAAKCLAFVVGPSSFLVVISAGPSLADPLSSYPTVRVPAFVAIVLDLNFAIGAVVGGWCPGWVPCWRPRRRGRGGGGGISIVTVVPRSIWISSATGDGLIGIPLVAPEASIAIGITIAVSLAQIAAATGASVLADAIDLSGAGAARPDAVVPRCRCVGNGGGNGQSTVIREDGRQNKRDTITFKGAHQLPSQRLLLTFHPTAAAAWNEFQSIPVEARKASLAVSIGVAVSLAFFAASASATANASAVEVIADTSCGGPLGRIAGWARGRGRRAGAWHTVVPSCGRYEGMREAESRVRSHDWRRRNDKDGRPFEDAWLQPRRQEITHLKFQCHCNRGLPVRHF